MSFADTPHRAVRHFCVFRGEKMVLNMEDTPGRLYSVASPPPGGAPPHPFVNARAYDPFSEGDLAAVLWDSSNFDDFLARLIADGLDVASLNDSSAASRTPAERLFHGDRLIGAVWQGAGQFTSLAHQPPDDTLVFSHVMLTSYDESEAENLLSLVQATGTFSELHQRVQQAGYALRPTGA